MFLTSNHICPNILHPTAGFPHNLASVLCSLHRESSRYNRPHTLLPPPPLSSTTTLAIHSIASPLTFFCFYIKESIYTLILYQHWGFFWWLRFFYFLVGMGYCFRESLILHNIDIFVWISLFIYVFGFWVSLIVYCGSLILYQHWDCQPKHE